MQRELLKIKLTKLTQNQSGKEKQTNEANRK